MTTSVREEEPLVEDPIQTGSSTSSGQTRQAGRRRLVILGGGVAGLTAAFELQRRVGKRADVTLISDRGQFLLPMGLLAVPFTRRSDEVGFPLAPALARKGIGFRRARVDRIDPMRRVVVVEGEEVPYDFLLIATGPDTDGGSVPGLGGEFNFAHFVHTEGAALETSGGVERFLDNPGPAVVGLARGAAYLSPAYEFVLWLDYSLRRRGNRDRATLTFVTPEEHLGHLGVGTPRAQQHLERAFARRNISVYTSAEIERIGADHVDLHGGTQLPSVLTTVVPGFRGMAGIWKTSGLTDSLGYVPVDEYYRHRQYPEIYAAGVAADPEAIVAAHTSVPKTGYLATSMAKAAARSMAAAVTWTVPNARALPRVVDIRIVDGGDVGLLLLSIGRTRPLRLALSLPGRLSHYLKRTLNRYVLWKLRTGRTYLP